MLSMWRGAWVCSAAAFLMIAEASFGYVVLGEFIWDGGNSSVEGWTEDESFVELTNPNAGGNPVTGGYLNIAFDDNRGPGQSATLVYVSPSSLFAGAWNDEMWIQFDFWAESQAPGGLELQWQSATNSQVWRYSLTNVTAGAWTPFSAAFQYSDWYYGNFGGGTEDQFLADLSTINWIGVYLFDGGTGEAAYGLDNWQLMVPEPGEYALACTALAMTFMAVRRRSALRGASRRRPFPRRGPADVAR